MSPMIYATTQAGTRLTATADAYNVHVLTRNSDSDTDRTYVLSLDNAKNLHAALSIAIRDAELCS